MKHLANKEIFSILNDLKIKNFTINKDGSVDVDGHVSLSNRNLNRIPIQFGLVTGTFECRYNQLITLVGSPKNVGGNYQCNNNNLTSLEGGPNNVTGYFTCNNNRITNLEGSPKYVGGSFHCGGNNLTSLVGSPSRVGGLFYCNWNQLTSLIGAPKEVDEDFLCYDNPLPQEILDNYDHIKYIVKYQDVYNIWRSDGSLDLFRFQEMMKDI